MIALEVWKNGQKLCTAGFPQPSCVNFMLWLRKGDRQVHGDFCVSGSVDEQPCERAQFASRNAQVGDEIVIRIVETELADEPQFRELV